MDTAIDTLRKSAMQAEADASAAEWSRNDNQHSADKYAEQRGRHLAKAADAKKAIAMMEAAQAATTQAAPEPALPSKAWDAAGWIEWKGGVMPAEADAKYVDIRLRDGSTTPKKPAGTCKWRHESGPFDIVAYKVIEEEYRGQEMIKGPGGQEFKVFRAGFGQPSETKGKRVRYLVRHGNGAQTIADADAVADSLIWELRDHTFIDGYIVLDDKPEESGTPELPEGFTPWAGGAQPAETKGKNVSVRFNDGYCWSQEIADALRWHHTGKPGDIVGYRVL